MSQQKHEYPGFLTDTSLIQLGYGVWVNLTLVGVGLVLGFTAISLPQLVAPDSSIQPTLSDVSWIASVMSLACPLGCLTGGIMMDKLGRRPTLIFGQVPICMGWLYTGFARSASDMILGRVITGAGCGMTIGPTRAFVTEISLPNLRGVIGSIPNVALSTGVMTQATLGVFLQWQTICFICAVYSTILLFLNIFLPETPYYVLMKSSIEKAKVSLKKFRGKHYMLDREMDELEKYKRENDIHRLSLKETIKALFRASACKPFCLLVPYVLAAQFSGISIVMFWTVDLLKDCRSTIDPSIGNVILAVTRLCSGILTCFLLYRVGRRPLALISAVGISIVCIVLGLFIRQTLTPSIFPQLCFIAYIVLGSLGYYTLPTLIMYEVYPLQIRGVLGGVSVSFINFAMFASNKSFPYVRNAIGLPFTVVGFGICSILGSIYIYLFLPETKGLTLYEIEAFFNKRLTALRSLRDLRDVQEATRTNTDTAVRINSDNQSLGKQKIVETKKLNEN